MAATLLDGTKVANDIKAEVTADVRRLNARGICPVLAAVLVGDHPASEVYVRHKVKACEEVGIESRTLTPPADVSTKELLELVAKLNADDEVDGILVQLPLPRQVDRQAVLLAIEPDKDVDGFHPVNLGRIASYRHGPVACTPAGIMELLRRSHIRIEGTYGCVIGRSEIVGRPTAMLLTNANSTVTLCHSHTPDIPHISRQADILVSAVGKAGLVTKDYVKPGAVVVDVGVNRLATREEFDRFFKGDAAKEAAFAKKGSVLVGDVHPEVAAIAGYITPVPGGVGPLTVAMLMVNTVHAAQLRRGLLAASPAEAH